MEDNINLRNQAEKQELQLQQLNRKLIEKEVARV